MSKNSIKVSIMDIDYVIKSDDNEEYIKRTAYEVENSIKGIMRDYKSLSAMAASILVALDYNDQAIKASENSDNLRNQIKECLEENSALRMELDDVRRENERIKKELNTLRVRFSSSASTDAQPIVNKSDKKDNSASNINVKSPISRQEVKAEAPTSKNKSSKNNTKDPREEIISFFDDED